MKIFKQITLITFLLLYAGIVYYQVKEIDNPNYAKHQSFLKYRFTFPIYILILFSSINIYFKRNYLNFFEVIRNILSIPFLIFGMNWLMIFGTTSYRSGRSVEGVVIGFIFIIIGIYLNINLYAKNRTI